MAPTPTAPIRWITPEPPVWIAYARNWRRHRPPCRSNRDFPVWRFRTSLNRNHKPGAERDLIAVVA